MIEEIKQVIEPKAMSDFVETRYVKDITHRALAYLKAGFPVHFRGASGTGKTTLALHLASKLNRPVIMLHGDEDFSSSDLVGGEYGYRMKKVVDRFVSRVMKLEENMEKRWVDSRLTTACKYGFTLIYDEYTRSRPEANNILLSILQEKIMDMPTNRGSDESYLKVDPQFKAIFTSNPEEYAGVYKSQDALRDRMITLDLGNFDLDTEIAITKAKAKISRKNAGKIVGIVQALRDTAEIEFPPTIRGSIMIAKTMKSLNISIEKSNGAFLQICQDILASETSRLGNKTKQEKVKEIIRELVKNHLITEEVMV